MKLSGADIVIKTLIEQGCDVVFGYPGGQIINIYDSLYKYQDEIKHVLTAHEQGAAHAADGYARATGKVGVVFATSGPGATNLVTGIATAFLDSVPLVAITGNVSSTLIGTDSFQEIDISGITLPITKHNYVVSNVEDLADTIREAFVIASSGRPGPVLVDIPKDVQIAKCEYEPKEKVTPEPNFSAKGKDLLEAASIINDSERPFVYVGGGAVISNAKEEIIELANLLDAPIGCSFMGLGEVPTDTKGYLGMQGMHGHYASSYSMHKSDCIIALGARFNDRVTGNKTKFAKKARIVHIDIDNAEIGKMLIPAKGLHGDVKLTLQNLIPLLKKVDRQEWVDQVAKIKQFELDHQDKRKSLTPTRVIKTLNKYINANTPIATDVGQHQMWTAQNIELKQPRRFISSGGLGTMGFGMGAAIGAYFGINEKPVLVTSEGSFGMNLNEIATAVTNNVPMVILLMNNGVLGMVRQWQTLFFDKHYSNTVLDRKTDFIALAKAFGANGVEVKNEEELNKALEKAFKAKGPFIVECYIDKDELVLPMLPQGGSMDDIIVKVGE